MTAIMHSPDHRVERSAVSEVDGIGVIVRLAKVLEIVLADVGLTMNQFRLLTLVEDRSPSAAELSRRLVMKPPNVSALTAGMVKRGLIEQRRQLGDGRRRILALTPAALDYPRTTTRLREAQIGSSGAPAREASRRRTSRGGVHSLGDVGDERSLPGGSRVNTVGPEILRMFCG